MTSPTRINQPGIPLGRSIKLRGLVTGIVTCFVFGGVSLQPAQAQLQLTDSDRVMFVSTAPLWPAGFGMRAESFLAVRYPQLKAKFWHLAPAMKPTMADAQAHLGQHLKAFHPTVVVLNLGLYHAQEQGLRKSRLGVFQAELQKMIDKCQKAGARVILVTPNFPETAVKQHLAKVKYDDVVSRYAETVRKVASSRDLPVVDWFAATKAVAEAGLGRDKNKLTIDGLVPAPLASGIGAEQFLQAIGAEPFNVHVHVDWKSLRAQGNIGSVDATKTDDGKLMLTMRGLPLPWCVRESDRRLKPAYANSAMGRLVLHVENAPDGAMMIVRPQKKKVRPLTIAPAEVARGIDLAAIHPVYRTIPVSSMVGWIMRKAKVQNRFEQYLQKPLEGDAFAETNRLYLQAICAEEEATEKLGEDLDRSLDIRLMLWPASAGQ